MRVKFNRDSKYPQSNPADCREYKAGETYDLTDDHAGRWIRRGVAVEVVPEPATEPEPAKEESPPAEASTEASEPKSVKQSPHHRHGK
jgi:hypothetical protein